MSAKELVTYLASIVNKDLFNRGELTENVVRSPTNKSSYKTVISLSLLIDIGTDTEI